MPGFDERLKQHLERLAPPADPSGAFDRILEKKIRRRVLRRIQAAGLAVAVVTVTVGGTFFLVRAFQSSGTSERFGQVGPKPGPLKNGRIAYTKHENDNYDIWTVNPDGTDAQNITADSSDSEYVPAWSPDGAKIAFIRERASDNDLAIYVMNADGSNAVRVKDVDVANHALAWSPDGNQIAYVSRGDLFVVNADGSGSRRITSGSKRLDFSPTWAPDGSWIAFARDTFNEPLSGDPFVGQEPAGSGLWAVRPDGSGLTRLTEGPDPNVGLDESPDWSPDGRSIVFQRANDIYILDVEESGLTKLTDGGTSSVPVWSPDGRKIVFERAPSVDAEVSGLFVMDADGSDVTQLRIGSVEQHIAPDWQPISAPSSSQGPTTEPSPTTTPSPLPAKCDASQVTGDFDGNGVPDTATVARTECFPSEPGNAGSRTEYSLRVEWPPSEGIAPLPDCGNVCKALAASDLNLDGIDEFILKVDEGSSTYVIQIYELPASEAFGDPSDVAEPGAPGFPAGRPARFSLGGSVEHYVALGCDLIQHQVIVQIAELNAEKTRYAVHEILLTFAPTEAPPFGRFTVVSERDFTEPYETGVGPGDQFEPGEPCWMQAF